MAIRNKYNHGTNTATRENTAITQIINDINIKYENNYITAILTDLLAAFDTIENTEILDKL